MEREHRQEEGQGQDKAARLTRGQMAMALRIGSDAAVDRDGPAPQDPDGAYEPPPAGFGRAGAGITVAMLVAGTLAIQTVTGIPAVRTNSGDGSPSAGAGRGSIPRAGGGTGAIQDNESRQEQQKMFGKLTGVAAATAVGVSTTIAGAQATAVQWKVSDGGNGHWYAILSHPQRVSWTASDQIAQAINGHLVTITSAAEGAFLGSAWCGLPNLNVPGYRGPWIGLRFGGGSWNWVTGEEFAYSAWAPNQPDNLGSQNCVGWGPCEGLWGNEYGDDPFNPVWVVVEWSADCNSDGIVDYGQCHDGSLPDENRNNVPDCCEQAIECRIREPGIVSAWGGNAWGERNVPTDLADAVQVAGGNDHVLALRANGTVRAWGRDTSGQATVPADLADVVQVEGGGDHSVALRADGSIRCWGGNDFGQCDVPAGLPGSLKVDAGGLFTVALGIDGSVHAWGLSNLGQTHVPSDLGGVSNISAGDRHTVALRSDGSVRCWGDDSQGQSNVPQGTSGVLAIAAGSFHTMVLRVDGSVACWGTVNSVPGDLGTVRAIAGGGAHAIALLTDGQVRSWGRCSEGQCQTPANLQRVQSIAGWSYGTLSVSSDGYCSADLTQNSTVDGADLGALLAFWGPVNPVFPQADINGDGEVNGADLGILLSVWGPCGRSP